MTPVKTLPSPTLSVTCFPEEVLIHPPDYELADGQWLEVGL